MKFRFNRKQKQGKGKKKKKRTPKNTADDKNDNKIHRNEPGGLSQ
jgi:hypothetical protein